MAKNRLRRSDFPPSEGGLHKLSVMTIDEVSHVRTAANPHAKAKLMKSDEALTSRGALLKSLAVAASRDVRRGETPEMAFARHLEENPGTIAAMRAMPDQSAPALAALLQKRAPDDGPVPPADAQYELLMKQAQRLVDRGHYPTIAQAFAKLYSGKPMPAGADETDDDDADSGDAGDLDFDDDGDVDMGLGVHPADSGAAGQGRNHGR